MRYRFDRKEFFEAVIQNLEWKSQNESTNYGDYFEFGVWEGKTSLLFFQCLKEYYGKNIPNYWHMYLADSFVGLPDSNQYEDINPQFKPGDYDVGGAGSVKNFLLENGVPEDRFTLIEGYYENSLTQELMNSINSSNAGLIYLDCDFYSSSVLCLDWIKPLIRNRTILYLDDMWSYAGNPHKGEYGALLKFNEKEDDVGFIEYPILGQNSKRVYLGWRDNLEFLK